MIELRQREKTLILIAIIIFIPLILFRFVISPIQEQQFQQYRKAQILKEKINRINLLGQEYQILKRENEVRKISLNKRTSSILGRLRLKSRSRTLIQDSPGKEQRLILKLDEINLTELTQLIYRIEDSTPVIIIENIEINPAYDNKKLFRISMALNSK